MVKIEIYNQVILISALIGISLFVFNFIFLFSNTISLLAIAFVLSGPAVLEYVKFHHNREVEERFPDFLQDISRNIKSGMTFTQAVKATKNINYGALSPNVKKIVNQIDW